MSKTPRKKTRPQSPGPASRTRPAPSAGSTKPQGSPVAAESPARGSARADRRRERQAQEKRKRVLRTAASVAAVVILALAVWGGYRWWAGPDVSADVVTYFGPDAGNAIHPEDDIVVLYEQVPPVGGPHNAVWQTCGFYDEYIFNWHGVHSMEHGAVWLTFDPGLPQGDIDRLRDLGDQGHVLVSPYPGLDAPVVGSVWGKQMTFTGADDERIEAFIKQYRLNPDNTPEQGASCIGGAPFTTDQEPQQEAYRQADPDATPIGGVTSTEATATAAAGN